MIKKKIFFCLLILFMCTSCTKNSSDRVVNILNWSSYIPGSVILDFERETGINVNYGTYSSNEECLAKVSVAKEGTYDLIFPSDYMVEIMINRGLIEEIDKSRLNNIDNLNFKYLDLEYDPKNIYTLPFIAASTVISVNRDVISDKIDSYNDLLEIYPTDTITESASTLDTFPSLSAIVTPSAWISFKLVSRCTGTLFAAKKSRK